MKESKIKLLEASGFVNEVALVKEGKCPFCSAIVDKEQLKDELSKVEFELSGLCQSCQDKMFG